MEHGSVVEAIRPEAHAPEIRPASQISLIGHVQVSLSAQIGTAEMSVERLFGLKAGDEVVLNELLDAPVTLMLNGRPVARAELVAIEDHFGVRIVDIA